MTVKPLGERLLIKPIKEEEKSEGGIVLPDSAKEKPQKAEVVAVGPGKVTEDGKTIPLTVKVGDKVLIGKYAGNEIKIDDEEFVIAREDEILAKIEE